MSYWLEPPSIHPRLILVTMISPQKVRSIAMTRMEEYKHGEKKIKRRKKMMRIQSLSKNTGSFLKTQVRIKTQS